MITNPQSQILHNPLLLTQTSQSFSYSPIIPPSQLLITTALSIDPIKQLLPSSSSSIITTTETIENSHSSVSPLHINETNQSSIPSDTTTQPPVNKKKKICFSSN
jgi:hypothetical protein